MLAALVGVGVWFANTTESTKTHSSEYTMNAKNSDAPFGDGSCNVAVIPISGEIVPYAGAYDSDPESFDYTDPDYVTSLLHDAEDDSDIKGVLVRIDSGGGSPVASEIMANAFKHSSLPVVALIREIGASGAYLAATGAKTIIASPFSDVGSIGITMSYVDNSAKNTKDGLQYESLTSAKFKDYGNPDKPLTDDERTLFKRDLAILHEQFVKEVSENRHLPINTVEALADGSSMPGGMALKNSLIDQLGDEETAREWFAKQLNMSPEDIVFCDK